MSLYRKEHKKEYWDTQTQAENMWIHKWQEDSHKQNITNLQIENAKIFRSSWSTKKHLDFLEKRKANVLEKMRIHDIRLIGKHTSKKLMLDAMELYCEREWPTLATVDMNIDANKIIPSTVLRNKDYHDKLQRLAMYADMGDHKEMQRVMDNKSIMERKNTLLVPIYRDLKSHIRFMSYTPEF